MILTVLGARPQFVKAAVLSREFINAGIKEEILHTGQHYDHNMSQVFFEELGLPGATLNLNIGSGSHGQQTAEMLIGIEKFIIERKKQLSALLVYGDTNSTLAGALVAAKLHIPVIHVEAGLRSFNKTMPEEINRITTDHLSDILFCSSQKSVAQLSNEGITKGVYVSGDIMLDAFNIYSSIAEQKLVIADILPSYLIENYCLLTIHRPTNTDNENLQEILAALGSLDYSIVWPVHPRNRARINGLSIPGNVYLTEPFSYFEMMVVLKHAKRVITDSGGLQKEAYWVKKPCITIRPETEWVETLVNNWNVLVDVNKDAISRAVNIEIDRSTWVPLYGDGNAASKMVQVLKQKYSKLQDSLVQVRD